MSWKNGRSGVKSFVQAVTIVEIMPEPDNPKFVNKLSRVNKVFETLIS